VAAVHAEPAELRERAVNVLSEVEQIRVMRLLKKGMSYRAIEGKTGHHRDTVMRLARLVRRWLRRKP
jgi:uncharacterized protein YerC